MLVVDPRSAARHPEQSALPPAPRQPEGSLSAGPGPWVPPLPPSRPALSARALSCFGIVAVLLLISAAAATAVLVADAAGPSASPSLDARYLGSVRGNSTLTGADIDDDTLVRAGHEICGIVDRRPTISTVLGMMQLIGHAQRWSDSDVAAVVGSAIGAYCPRYIAVLDR